MSAGRMATEEAEGDRVIEIVSAGSHYRRGGDWERKYWSCSRVRLPTRA